MRELFSLGEILYYMENFLNILLYFLNLYTKKYVEISLITRKICSFICNRRWEFVINSLNYKNCFQCHRLVQNDGYSRETLPLIWWASSRDWLVQALRANQPMRFLSIQFVSINNSNSIAPLWSNIFSKFQSLSGSIVYIYVLHRINFSFAKNKAKS
jgi:hypothetical protein